MSTVTTDICIIGAGPVGLFAVFEAGLLKMKCHVIDALPQVGGQLSEIYPKKPIYDIPGFPSILAGELVTNLMEQIKPFHPTFTLGERVETLDKQEDGSFRVVSSEGTEIFCKVVVIAGGLGSFEPRKPAIENLTDYEGGKGVNYMILDPEHYRDKRVVLAGGGEIIGKPTDLPWAFKFMRNNELFNGVPAYMDPRHPSQLYESLFCLVLFILLYWLWKRGAGQIRGLLFGLFVTLLFTFRFLIEFTKENQEKFEDELPLNMGQWLSIPLILIGIAVLVYSLKQPRQPKAVAKSKVV